LTPGLISGLASETQTMLLQLLSNSGTAPADSPAGHINIAAVLQQLGMLEPNHFSTGQEQKLLQDSTVGADALASSSGAAGQSPLVAMPAQPARASAGQGQLAQPAQSSQPAVLRNSSFKTPPTGVGPVLDKQIPQAQQQQQREDKQQLDQEQSKQQQHGLAQPASGALAQLSQGQSQMLLHLLEPTQQQQQLQQQQQQQHRTPLGLPVSTPQQQQALMQLASFISTAAAPPPEPTTAAAAATDGAVREQSSVSGSSTLQQLLAMALGGALPGSGGAGQQQHGHSGFSMQSNTEVGVKQGATWVSACVCPYRGMDRRSWVLSTLNGTLHIRRPPCFQGARPVLKDTAGLHMSISRYSCSDRIGSFVFTRRA
jgi:hypothetical protein